MLSPNSLISNLQSQLSYDYCLKTLLLENVWEMGNVW